MQESASAIRQPEQHELQREIDAQHETGSRYLTFYLDEEYYGVEIIHVREIIAHMKTTRIPKTAACMKGVMNLRGNIIPVVDTRLKFGLESREHDMLTAIVIMEVQGVNIGFVVDRVEEVVTIPEDNINDTPTFGAKISTDYIKHIGQAGKEVVMVLNLDVIFSEQEMEAMENSEV